MEVGFSSNLIIGLVLVSLTAVVILGGIGRISKIASKMVPSMVLLYFISVEVRNAFRPKTTLELYQALYDANEDTSIGVVLLSASRCY